MLLRVPAADHDIDPQLPILEPASELQILQPAAVTLLSCHIVLHDTDTSRETMTSALASRTVEMSKFAAWAAAAADLAISMKSSMIVSRV